MFSVSSNYNFLQKFFCKKFFQRPWFFQIHRGDWTASNTVLTIILKIYFIYDKIVAYYTHLHLHLGCGDELSSGGDELSSGGDELSSISDESSLVY